MACRKLKTRVWVKVILDTALITFQVDEPADVSWHKEGGLEYDMFTKKWNRYELGYLQGHHDTLLEAMEAYSLWEHFTEEPEIVGVVPNYPNWIEDKDCLLYTSPSPRDS